MICIPFKYGFGAETRETDPPLVTGEFIHMAVCMVPRCVMVVEVVMRITGVVLRGGFGEVVGEILRLPH